MTGNTPTYPDLTGKVAVVTGGSGGIGAATCRLLAANGVKVAVNGRDEAKIDAVVSGIQADGGRAIGVAADVTDFAGIERMRRRVEQELGLVDVLVAFAASGGPPCHIPASHYVIVVVTNKTRPMRRGGDEEIGPTQNTSA